MSRGGLLAKAPLKHHADLVLPSGRSLCDQRQHGAQQRVVFVTPQEAAHRHADIGFIDGQEPGGVALNGVQFPEQGAIFVEYGQGVT
jgi:hypothetical protein